MTADAALLAALAACASALRRLGRPAMIIGGIAVIARGVPRQTVDIDATMWAEGLDVDAILPTLAAEGLVPRTADAVSFARERHVLLLRHEPTGTPLELVLAYLPFERSALERADLVDFGGVRVPTATAEDLIVYKAIAWRDRDRSDVERLLALHGRSIDLERVRAVLREFATALDEPERLEQFEALLRRALGDGTG
jgi:predicted nucleotidyltransferase